MRLTATALSILCVAAAFPSGAWAQLAREGAAVPLESAALPALPPAAVAAPTLDPALAPLPALALSPALAAPPAVPSVAAVAATLAAAPSLVRAARAAQAGAAPAPARAKETSAQRLAAIARARDAAPLWTGARPGASSAEPVGAAPGGAPSNLLAAPLAPANAAAEPIVIPAPNLGRRLRDAVHYARVTGSSLAWYTFPRLIERWDEMREALADAAGRPRAVRRVMSFFIAHRVLGSTGSYAPMGFRVAADRVVAADAWRIYDRHFAPDPAARDAFARLVARAETYNPNRRSTQFRKVLFHALREGAVLPPAELPAFFDSLLTPGKEETLAAYQAAEQPRVLALFESITGTVIRELNEGQPRGRRVVAAVLLGSFANGAAGPGSDLDVQTVTEDGSAARNPEFLKRLKARWKAEGDPSHPVSGFDYALPPSKTLLTRIHREPYVLVSPYPEVRAALTAAPAEFTGHDTTPTLKGRLFIAAYSAVLFSVLAGYDAWRRLRGR